MRTVTGLLAACALAMPAAAQASPALPPATVAAIESAFARCTGRWYAVNENWKLIGPADLAPRLALLSRPSTELEADAAQDLYKIAHGLLVPAVAAPDWILDRGSSLKCPARPIEAVALMTYLAGSLPGELRGAANVFDWLGLAQETGVVGPPDPALARRYYLRGRMHSALLPSLRWTDGIDDDLIGNIERAGMRPYLEGLVASKRGEAARMILAEERLPTDPAGARRLLLNLYAPSLNRLLALEEQGRVPIVADAADIRFWSEAWATMMGYQRWAERMVKGAELANGGTIPTSAVRPSIDSLRPYLDTVPEHLQATRTPLAVRALVDRQGRALYVETCAAAPPSPQRLLEETGVRLNASRLYFQGNALQLPVTQAAGRPIYAWVILPAVQFVQEGAKVAIRFTELPAESCAYSDMLGVEPFASPAARPSRS